MKLNKKIWKDLEEFNKYMSIYVNTMNHKFKNCKYSSMSINKWASLASIYSNNTEKYYDLVINKETINDSGHIPKTPFIKNGKVIYKLYIKSLYWREKRLKHIKDCKNVCQCCNYEYLETDLNLHHHTYDRVGEELDSDLVIVCRECHHKIHFNNGVKVSLKGEALRDRFNLIKN